MLFEAYGVRVVMVVGGGHTAGKAESSAVLSASISAHFVRLNSAHSLSTRTDALHTRDRAEGTVATTQDEDDRACSDSLGCLPL